MLSGGPAAIPGIQWGAPLELPVAAAGKALPTTRALALASADVDLDGYPDLFSGFGTDSGGLLAIHRGNPEAWAPKLDISHALIRAGQFPPGFLAEARTLTLPVAPELMVAGDFDHDGHPDLALAQRGDRAVYLLRGGRDGFGSPEKLAQAGAVDALAAGHIDQPDGFADLAIAVSDQAGASLRIHSAGIDARARVQALPAAATELHVGQVDSSPMGDVVALAAGKVLVLHGIDRSGAAGDTLETLDFGFAVQTLALGNFIWDRDGHTELALLKDDGSIQIAARGTLTTTPFTLEEVRAKRRAQIAATSTVVKSWRPGIDAGWRIAESLPAQMSKAAAGAAPDQRTAERPALRRPAGGGRARSRDHHQQLRWRQAQQCATAGDAAAGSRDVAADQCIAALGPDRARRRLGGSHAGAGGAERHLQCHQDRGHQ